jgi:hypothetical protein
MAAADLFVLGRQGVNRIASYEEQLVGYSADSKGAIASSMPSPEESRTTCKPVASLTLSVDLMSRKAASEETPALDRMRRSIKRISAMIDDLLAFARADAHPDGAPCNPAVVAAKIRDDFTERFGDAASLHEIVEPASVGYNEGLLRQVLWNLVENGVKYRRDDVPADIGIFGRVVGGRYELQVSDNGLGMLPEEARRAFDPFYRGQRVQDVSGTGLGLSIVKRIVEGGGGSVLVKTQLGSGTTFVLQLPVAGSQEAEELSADFPVIPVHRDSFLQIHSRGSCAYYNLDLSGPRTPCFASPQARYFRNMVCEALRLLWRHSRQQRPADVDAWSCRCARAGGRTLPHCRVVHPTGGRRASRRDALGIFHRARVTRWLADPEPG